MFYATLVFPCVFSRNVNPLELGVQTIPRPVFSDCSKCVIDTILPWKRPEVSHGFSPRLAFRHLARFLAPGEVQWTSWPWRLGDVIVVVRSRAHVCLPRRTRKTTAWLTPIFCAKGIKPARPGDPKWFCVPHNGAIECSEDEAIRGNHQKTTLCIMRMFGG